MDSEIKLNLEKWDLKLDGEIKYLISLESDYTYILTQRSFYIYDKPNNNLIKNQIPDDNNGNNSNLASVKNETSTGNRIWPDKYGIHIIFKLDGICYYYNNILKENKKIKRLKLISEENKIYIEPFALSFNDINKNQKNSDEIIFTDKDSIIYTLNIKLDNKGEISEKINKIFDIKSIRYIDLENSENNEEDVEEEGKNNELDNYLEDNYFILENDDKIYDIKLFVKEEKTKRFQTTRNYFILAVSKRIIFQFKGKNSINEIFSKNKKDNKFSIKNLIINCKIFPKLYKIPLENPKLQLIKSKDKKIIFSWNSESGFTFWEMLIDNNDGNILPQKDFNLYKYIKIKQDGNLEKKPCPIACLSTSRNIYYLYNDCLMIMSTLTNNIIYTKYFEENREPYLDMFYNPDMKRIIIYSSYRIIKLSLEHEYNNLWEDYIQKGEYDLALQFYPKEDEIFKAKLRKLKANYLFNKKDYESAGFDFALSDENFEHVCMKFFKLNEVNNLINYLDLVNKLRLAKIEENKKSLTNENIFLIQKYLINTWLLELILEKIDKNKNMNNDNNKTKNMKIQNENIKEIINRSGYIDSKNYLDKLIIFYALRNYGKHEDFEVFAGLKNDYKAIIFELVNHYKYKDAIDNLINYMSYDNDEIFLKKLIKIFFIYSNIFVKESPQQVMEILDEYYYLIENPKDIIKILINLDDIYDNKMDEETFEKVLNFIKKFLFFPKKSKKNKEYQLNLDDATKQNFYNLYILYISKSYKIEHINEFNDYLKSLITNRNKLSSRYLLNVDNYKVFFEFSFAENLFKKNKSSLALLYCLKKQYNKSISYAVKCSDKNIPIFIANSISDLKKKKEIWLSIFKYSKANQIKLVEEILQKSNGVLTITDILPYLMGNVQLKEILTNLNKYIDDYEFKLRKLKININDFAKSEEIVSKKINRITNYAQKNLRVKFEEIFCCMCLKNLNENNFFLFPCRHDFDFDCIINLLLYYDSKNIGDEVFKNRIKSIKSIINTLQKAKQFKDKINPLNKKNSLNDENRIRNSNTFKGFFKNFTLKNNFKNINLDNEDELINSSINELEELLNEECPLCGNEAILDVQTKFGEENDIDWAV